MRAPTSAARLLTEGPTRHINTRRTFDREDILLSSIGRPAWHSTVAHWLVGKRKQCLKVCLRFCQMGASASKYLRNPPHSACASLSFQRCNRELDSPHIDVDRQGLRYGVERILRTCSSDRKTAT